MLLTILGWVTGLSSAISSVTNRVLDLKIAQAEAQSNTEKSRIERDIQESEDRRQVLIAEAGDRINSLVRFSMALGVTFYLNKILIWDKVLGSFVGCAVPNPIGCETFRTDPLDNNAWWFVTAVVAFYFLYDIASRMRK